MKIENSIEISKPPSEVYEFLRQDENMTLWVSNFVRVERVSGEEGETGTVCKLYYDEGGRMVEMEEEILRAVENELIEIELRHEMTDIQVRFTLEPVGEDATRLHTEYHYQPKSILFKVYLSFNRGRLTERYQEDLERLKDAVEELSDEFEDLEE